MTRRTTAPVPHATLALDALVGAALVLDRSLRVVTATPSLEALLGVPIAAGAPVAAVLCGGAIERPIAEALAAGRAVEGTIVRETRRGAHEVLHVRATPLHEAGWMLLVREAEALGGVAANAVMRFHGMLTRDPAMKQVFHVVQRAARRDVPVLVRGETGTGKELVARAVHECSPRARGPFRAVNCAALPATLLESELFGHVRGAFTGALRDHAGIFRATDRGTLFLDEIAEMPLELQAKLLRVLETHTVIPVGGSDALAVDVRIVAATHQSLRRAVAEGRFRADLMYRLRVVPIFLPPLRGRAGDVALLAQHFVDELNAAGERHVTSVAPGALTALAHYAWPGNVRELRNALEYAFVIGEGAVLTEGDLPPEIAAREPDDRRLEPLPALKADDGDGGVEVQRIRRALARAHGNRTGAAKILGLSRVTLWRRMKELGL
jgi:transcriptional regulator with PAS, ATPase and Fis domain